MAWKWVCFCYPSFLWNVCFISCLRADDEIYFFSFFYIYVNEEHPSKMLMFLHKICIIKFKEFSFCQPYNNVKAKGFSFLSLYVLSYFRLINKCVYFIYLLLVTTQNTLICVLYHVHFNFLFISSHFLYSKIQQFSFIQH